MKILCISLPNRDEHNKQAENSLIKQEPVVYTKADSALLRTGMPFFVPDFAEQFDAEPLLVIRINRLGKDIGLRFAHRYYAEATVGIGFTARDLWMKLNEAGQPWDLSKGFDGSTGVGKFTPIDADSTLCIALNGQTMTELSLNELPCTVDEAISQCSRFYTLKMGDFICLPLTGQPWKQRVFDVKEGDMVEGFLNGQQVMKLKIK